MLITQANPAGIRPIRRGRRCAIRGRWRRPTASPTVSREFLTALRAEVIAFRKPVAYVHGDSHYFRVDKPFLDSAGRRLENFTRVETFGNNQANGNNDVQWLKVVVDVRAARCSPTSRRSFRAIASPCHSPNGPGVAAM